MIFPFTFDDPSFRFKGRSAKMPPIQPTPPIPVVGDAVEDAAIRKSRRRSGYEKTILTGDLSPNNGKLTTLGG